MTEHKYPNRTNFMEECRNILYPKAWFNYPKIWFNYPKVWFSYPKAWDKELSAIFHYLQGHTLFSLCPNWSFYKPAGEQIGHHRLYLNFVRAHVKHIVLQEQEAYAYRKRNVVKTLYSSYIGTSATKNLLAFYIN